MDSFKIPKENRNISITRTVRINESLLEKLEKVANKNNISTNKLIIYCIEYALNNMESSEKDLKQKYVDN